MGGFRGQQWWYQSKEGWCFLWALHCNPLTIWPKFAFECLRRSNQQEASHYGAKFGEEAVDRCKPILKRSGRNMELSYAKEISSAEREKEISSAVWPQCTNVTDRQTDRPRNGTIDTNRRNRFQRCCIIIGSRTLINLCSISVVISQSP